ncbi:MAG: YihY family inner membrane protein, partial [Gammaproteobacteria bacterium]
MRALRFLLRVWRRFVADHGLRTAAALAYTTLLSLVPLLAVVLSIFSAFPTFQQLNDRLQELLFQTFVPGTSEVIVGYLREFSAKAASLSAMGLAFLLFTALSLMSTIDSTLNQIWRVEEQRPAWLRFVIYWTVLTLGPLLVGLGLAATTYLLSLPALAGLDGSTELRPRLLSMLPWLLEAAAFILLYAL